MLAIPATTSGDSMNDRRRSFLAIAVGTGTLAATGLLNARAANAATWNKQGFEAKALNDAIKNLGAANLIDSKDIAITAPDIAENGAVVPVAVTSKIPNTQIISILAEKNPFPLAASFDVSNAI